ncbi:MAG TPA: cache domain-containing protein [Acidobacteriota bacterium]|jgi:two-component system NtrC family sensor kinase|nr:cache domain-containing protein [Acidobacteriota bacterium]HRR26360.1 cache domain-containing protein [Acidobacteriota bacterium]HRR56183.1 cache domain-containing protein [Acidobacteriota bacterium]HRV07627.1 cache domain-containing protein [Acidobacteriota bacterium]
MKLSLGVRLTLAFVLVVLVTAVLSMLLGYRLIDRNVIGQAYATTQGHLNTSRYIYENQIDVIRLFVEHLAQLDYLQEAVVRRDRRLLREKLEATRQELGLDIMNLVDPRGRVLMRARNPAVEGDSVLDNVLVRMCLEDRATVSGTVVMNEAELAREGADLAELCRIELLETPHARPLEKTVETRGLALMAGAPVFFRGRFLGVVYGARLLNRNYDFVDRIKSLCFGDEEFKGKEVGTATLFLDDVRISTNVRRLDGTRAIGTRVSQEVYEKVVVRGETWLDRAFVVNSWYISGYSPISDPTGRIVGILYVGVLEDKFRAVQYESALTYALIILVSSGVGVIFALYFIRRIVAPYRRLQEAARDIAQGHYERRLEGDFDAEMASLAESFNQMVDAIQKRDQALKEEAAKHISQSEKLASLGRLASGIAHEVNNPLTGILTYAAMLLEDLRGTEYEEDLKTIVDETLRCRNIVRNILDFARETSTERELTNLNRIVEETLKVLEHHVHFQNVRIVRHLDPAVPDQWLDVNQMKSVINNLAINAADAMQEGGTLTVTTRYHPRTETVRLIVEDTGVGIPRENLEKVFDPFFTTKEPGKGTGLGLAVTYGIVRRHGGAITIDSEVGRGTRVTIILPREIPPPKTEDKDWSVTLSNGSEFSIRRSELTSSKVEGPRGGVQTKGEADGSGDAKTDGGE